MKSLHLQNYSFSIVYFVNFDLELPPEEYGQRLCFVWGGSYYNSNRYFAEVQIGVFAKQPLHLPLRG